MTVLASLLLAAALPAGAGPSVSTGPVIEKALFSDLDPAAAEALLDDHPLLDALRAQDSVEATRLVERAARLKDLRQLLSDQTDAADLSAALRVRLSSAPAPLDRSAAELLRWEARYLPAADTGTLSQALFDWDTLSERQRRWLEKPPRPTGEALWASTPFEARLRELRLWADPIRDRILAAAPKTGDAMYLLDDDFHQIWAVLGADERRSVSERVEHARKAVDALEGARRAIGARLKDPALAALLAEARAAGSVGETLDALRRLYDKAGVPSGAIAAHAPTPAGQTISSLDAKLFIPALSRALHDELALAKRGRVVNDFFAQGGPHHELKLSVGDASGNVAFYKFATGQIVVDDAWLEDWRKQSGFSAQDLLSRPGALRQLAMLLAPVFVHEATHQIQHAWGSDRGISVWSGQNLEVEAKATESVFVLELEKADPAFVRFLKASQRKSRMARMVIEQLQQLRRDPADFPTVVRTDYYEGTPSLEAQAAKQMRDRSVFMDLVRAELARRAALPKAERDALDKRPEPSFDDARTPDKWREEIAAAPGPQLERFVARDPKVRDDEVRSFELLDERYTTQVADLLKEAAAR